MAHRLLTVFICFIAWSISHAQVLPAPGARLNYTQVMFEYEKVKGAAMYMVQVAEDTPRASFDHSLIEQRDSATATMISSLQFGRKYKWRYAGIVKGQSPMWRGPWHFSIDSGMLMRLGLLNLTVNVNDSANARGLIVNDATSTISDRTGRPVWYLPQVYWQVNTGKATVVTDTSIDQVLKVDVRPYIFDLRLTPYGTLTYLDDSAIIECDLNGNKLFYKHDCDTFSEMGEDHYNHVFLRMPNGNYMTLGNEAWRKMPTHGDTTKYKLRKFFNGAEYGKVEFGTVLEYNTNGDLVWSWNSEGYFDKYGSADPKINMELSAHINALSVDRNNEFVYVGFRDISRIIKVEKRTGMVVNSWGAPSRGAGPMHHLSIHKQHDATVLDDGNILIFDNNDYPQSDTIPRVVIFSQDTGQVVWRYDYDLNHATRRIKRTGGNAEQLPNGNILVCTGTADRIFEVTKDKKIVWQGLIKPRATPGYRYSYRLYRAHYISSLYPCYFAFVTDQDTVTKQSPEFSVRVFNKGSENDAYDVKISSASDPVSRQFSTQTLKPNTSATFTITPDKKLLREHKIEVSISSKTNPDLVRKSVVVYQ